MLAQVGLALAKEASVKQQLISYHYGSKLGLWKAVADDLFLGLQ